MPLRSCCGVKSELQRFWLCFCKYCWVGMSIAWGMLTAMCIDIKCCVLGFAASSNHGHGKQVICSIILLCYIVSLLCHPINHGHVRMFSRKLSRSNLLCFSINVSLTLTLIIPVRKSDKLSSWKISALSRRLGLNLQI